MCGLVNRLTPQKISAPVAVRPTSHMRKIASSTSRMMLLPIMEPPIMEPIALMQRSIMSFASIIVLTSFRRSACMASRVRLVAAVVVAAAGVPVGFFHPRDYRSGAAAIAAPRLATLLDRYARDDEGRHGVGPPQAEEGVGTEADE